MTKVILYSDGGARGNPGPAAIGVVLYDENRKELARISRTIGETTNNQAEYQALIAGLNEAKNLGAEVVICHLDSELVVHQLQGKYKVREESLKEPMMKALRLVNQFKQATFVHIPREKNQLADQLVNEALDQTT